MPSLKYSEQFHPAYQKTKEEQAQHQTRRMIKETESMFTKKDWNGSSYLFLYTDSIYSFIPKPFISSGTRPTFTEIPTPFKYSLWLSPAILSCSPYVTIGPNTSIYFSPLFTLLILLKC